MDTYEDKINDAYMKMFDDASRLDVLIDEYSKKEAIGIDDICALLNIAVIDEFLASFNYMISYSKSKTEGKADFDDEFKAHEGEERDHMMKLIERLRQLECPFLLDPIANYSSINSCGTKWKQETSEISLEILKHRWQEEIDAIKFYNFILMCIKRMEEAGNDDSTTKKLIEEIKKDEEEHELDLRDLMDQYQA